MVVNGNNKNQKKIIYAKKIKRGILTHVLVSVMIIVRFISILKIINVLLKY